MECNQALFDALFPLVLVVGLVLLMGTVYKWIINNQREGEAYYRKVIQEQMDRHHK